MKVAIILVVTLLALLSVVIGQECDQNPPWTYNYPQYSGRASWFDAVAQGGSNPQTGACGWTKSTTDNVVGAYTGPTTSSMCKLCGNCYSITGPNGTQVVRVIDYCDTNQPGGCGLNVAPQWTLHQPVFVAVCGVTSLGSAPVTWYGPVPCPLSSNLVYTGSSGTNVWYVAITIQGHRTPLQSVFFQSPGAGTNVYYNVSRHQGNSWWINPPTPQQWPFKIRVVDVAGNVVEDTIQLSTMSGTPQTGTGGNFPVPAGAPATASNTPSKSKAITPTSAASQTSAASASKSTAGSASATSIASASRTPSTTTTRSISPSPSLTRGASSSNSASKTSGPSITSSISKTRSASRAPGASSSSKPSNTPKPSTQPGQLSNVPVYTDAVVAPFVSWTWASNYSYTNNKVVYSGTYSTYYVPGFADALYYTCTPSCFNDSFQSISFYVHGGTAGAQRLHVQVVDENKKQIGGDYVFTADANKWKAITVLLSGLSLPKGTKLGGFWIQSLQASLPAGEMYVDQIAVLASSGSASVTMPAITSNKRSVDSDEDLINALMAVFPDVTTFAVQNPEGGEVRRDLDSKTVEASGLNADQVARIGDPEAWIPTFNYQEGTSINPADVAVKVVPPMDITNSESNQGSMSSGAERLGVWLSPLL